MSSVANRLRALSRQRASLGHRALQGIPALFVIPSAERLRNIRQLCGRAAFEPPRAKRFLWLTTDHVLQGRGVLTCPWVSIDPENRSAYSLMPTAPQAPVTARS